MADLLFNGVNIINRFSYLFGCIQISQTDSQPYSDTSHYEVSSLSYNTIDPLQTDSFRF